MKMEYNEILVRYGEIFLKSEPVMQLFERRLIENIKSRIIKTGIDFSIYQKRGRIFIKTKKIAKVCKILKKVFGIVSFSPCLHLETSEKREILEFFKQNYNKIVGKDEKFAVEVKRVGKHNYSSQELAREIGSVIKRKVDLANPDKRIFVEVRENDTYIYFKKIKGLGGLPVGVSGKVISLISGGIDSPIASLLAMKRGCNVIFVHFHSFPLVSKKSIEKTKKLLQVLREYQDKIKLYLIPFANIQLTIKAMIPTKYRIIFYRRFMLRICEEIARKEGAKALITGESLAQVSSQTLDNIAVIEEVTQIPILRPLIGMDKLEIIKIAKKIGTYEISVQPQEDCCTLFTPKHPTAQARIEIVKELERRIKIKKLMKDAIDKAEIQEI
ncbi:MAG: tRNA 4-thiouridine(8) synthase ThiI [Candidatus Parvarchaeota archaeon]|nr:tRNA 4-thiouridine(8) synthase ThiI [Candidatus Jingweiarchaeum tengchongense]MCW1298184.1 tRNA 4-thiouridine(8) synthase ThiI [Candidatus Jingweiarchaeum tengchongense]MCW1310423.1 tRNA 4-thiouridine(8) synthase ThiI [Candidatus Jingweiarchaeum tengchongense]